MSNLFIKQFFVPKLLMFLICLVLLIFCWWTFFPQPIRSKTKARIVFTRFETKEIATVLKQYSMKTDGLTNIDNEFVFIAVFGTNGDINLNYHPEQTNSQGQVLDCWRMPYQIEILARTNFIVSSAGPNKIFGDADDIIFNSVSNNFVNP
jgi:hypothetical protein